MEITIHQYYENTFNATTTTNNNTSSLQKFAFDTENILQKVLCVSDCMT